MHTDAKFFDGETAGSVPAKLTLLGNHLQVVIDGEHRSLGIHELELIEPIGSGAWIVELENGASIRIDDDAFGQLLSEARGDSGFVRKLERSWPWAVVALVVAIVSTWALLTFGVPAGARYVAFALPDDASEILSNDSMELLDRVLFSPSELPKEEQDRVRVLFEQIQATNDEFGRYRLEFRASSIGANAFAVPGGIVVMTDEMVELAESDAELLAVLAHEVGHLYNRHSLRIVLQNSASALIIASITGDLSSITALSATVPTVLMQAKYSRDFEREADEFSFAYLESAGLDPGALSELLMRLDGGEGSPISGWLSSHPRSEERAPSD